MMDPVILTSIVASALKVAGDLSSLALQQGLTPEQVQALWDAQRKAWNDDWAEWVRLQSGP